MGSDGGRERHADWYHNLLANPHAWVHIKRKRIPVTAVVLEGDERAQTWERVSAEFPNYTAYQERAQPREIPIVRLDPRGWPRSAPDQLSPQQLDCAAWTHRPSTTPARKTG